MAPGYAPFRPGDSGMARRSSSRWILRAVLAAALVVLGYYAAIGFRISHLDRSPVRQATPQPPPAEAEAVSAPNAEEPNSEPEDPTGLGLTPETLSVLLSLPTGPYVRDVYPARTMRALLSLSEAEIARSGVDSCGGRLGSSLISAWSSTARSYCKPEPEPGPKREPELRSSRRSLLHDDPQDFERGQQGITCFDPQDGRQSSWWAPGSYPCLSEWLESEGNLSEWRTELECSLPRSREKGALVNHLQRGEGVCERKEEAVLVVKRRDQWNP